MSDEDIEAFSEVDHVEFDEDSDLNHRERELVATAVRKAVRNAVRKSHQLIERRLRHFGLRD